MYTKRLILSVAFLLLSLASNAQCAMCRATIENNYSNGKPGIAAGLNVGILYLLIMPYLAILTLGFLWYRSSKANGKILRSGLSAR